MNFARWFTRSGGLLRTGTRRYATYRTFESKSGAPRNYNKYIQWGGSVAVLGGIFYVSNLDTAPYSNRSRFIIVPKALERRIGDQGYRQTLNEYGRYLLPENHPYTVKVRNVMQRLLAASTDPTNIEHSNTKFSNDLEWKVHVIDDPRAAPNAFVLPNGKVFVFTSILPICGNDDGLATVLAHETGHQLARHTAENLSKTPIYLLLGAILYTMTGSDLINQLVVNWLFQLPASREMEREADYVGLMIMSKACFNPNEAVHVWERMDAMEKKLGGAFRGMEFMSTHPTSVNRIKLIENWLPEANSLRAQSGCHGASDWNGFMDFLNR
ncbi:mitochondrial metalloendopeptidase Oma1p [Trichomonascus vanleenenianus]|uniref:metalloendopeptidase n=1 Tax=Trichomonascus vanleenenianus TaxID=2268995 RepID=UPI003EC9F8C5